jgi:phosphoglycolate phosphatase
VKHGLIFDLDGTLVDSLLGIAASLNHALGSSGLPVHSNEAVRGFVGNGVKILIRRASPADADEALLDTIERDFKAHYDLSWQTGTIIYPGITELLEALQSRGYPLAVLSNKPHPFTVAMVSQLFPSVCFAAVLGQRPGIPHKPDPAGALEISAALGLSPADCWVIGDSTMDIETARNAGMRAVAVTWGFHDRERLLAAGADQLVDEPEELLELNLEPAETAGTHFGEIRTRR